MLRIYILRSREASRPSLPPFEWGGRETLYYAQSMAGTLADVDDLIADIEFAVTHNR